MEFSNHSIFSLPALDAMLWFSNVTIDQKKKVLQRGLSAVAGCLCLGVGFYLRRVTGSDHLFSGLLAAFGGVLLIMTFAYPLLMTAVTRQQMRGQNYAYHFQFKNDAFTAGLNEHTTPYAYSSLYALRENDDYFALFLGPRQAFMVDKLGFQNRSDTDAFGPFLEEKTGLTIQRF